MLNARQKVLLEFLESQGGEPVRQEDIAYALPLLYPWDENGDFHASTARKIMTVDVREINADDEFGHMISSTGKGLKIATKEEFAKSMNSEFSMIFNKLSRARKKAKKGGLDCQGMFGKNGVEFIEVLMPKEAGA